MLQYLPSKKTLVVLLSICLFVILLGLGAYLYMNSIERKINQQQKNIVAGSSASIDYGSMTNMDTNTNTDVQQSVGMDHGATTITTEEQFIRDMIPHHQEAVDSSRYVLASENIALKQLAQEIIVAQDREINQMASRLQKRYRDSTEQAMYANMMPDLKTLSGVVLDTAYIEGMMSHHKGAIQMAIQVLALHPRAEVAQFAQKVIDVQTAEIGRLRLLLSEYKNIQTEQNSGISKDTNPVSSEMIGH